MKTFRRMLTPKGRCAILLLTLMLGGCATMPPQQMAAPSFGPPPAGGNFAESGAFGSYLAGRSAQIHHDLSPATEFLGRALAYDSDNIEILRRATIAFALQGRLKEAVTMARTSDNYDEESIVPAMLLASSAAKRGDWSAVRNAVLKLPAHGLNNYLVPLVRAWSYAGEGQFDSALEPLAALGRTNGLGVLRDFNVALINDLAHRPELAEAAFRATLKGNGGHNVRTISIFAEFLHRIGKEDEAVALTRAFADEHLDLPAFSIDNRPIVADAQQGLAEAFFSAAGTLRQANIPDLALLFTQLAIDLRGDFPLAKLMAGDILSDLGQFDEANATYRKLADLPAFSWTAKIRLARNLEEMEQIDAAAAQLGALIALHPDQPEAILALGDLWRRQKRWLLAVETYDIAIPLLPPDDKVRWSVYYARGIALERANLWPRAEADLLKALELQPNEPQLLNYLGYSWVEHNTNLPRATEMIEKAVKMRPTDGFIVDSLGWAFYRSGEFAKAVETLQRAVTMVPGDAAINDHLGDALWRAGRHDEARFQWQHALLFDPEPDLKAQLAEKLRDRQSPLASGNKDKK